MVLWALATLRLEPPAGWLQAAVQRALQVAASRELHAPGCAATLWAVARLAQQQHTSMYLSFTCTKLCTWHRRGGYPRCSKQLCCVRRADAET